AVEDARVISQDVRDVVAERLFELDSVLAVLQRVRDRRRGEVRAVARPDPDDDVLDALGVRVDFPGEVQGVFALSLLALGGVRVLGVDRQGRRLRRVAGVRHLPLERGLALGLHRRQILLGTRRAGRTLVLVLVRRGPAARGLGRVLAAAAGAGRQGR